MVVLNALKVLSSEMRHFVTVEYRPSTAVRKNFLLPFSIYVDVEIFPISDICVFSRSEPLYFIDGYLSCVDGTPFITPCTSDEFALSEWFDLVSQDGQTSLDKVTQCIEENIAVLVESAIAKTEKVYFPVEAPVTLRLAVFLLKMNRLKDASRLLQENMPSSYILSNVLPYIIYETLSAVLINRDNPCVLSNIAYISTALDGKLDTIEEDRVLSAILVGLEYSLVRRTPSILNMYSRMIISPYKASIFYYLLSLSIGEGYCTKYTLIGLSMDSLECYACSSTRKQSMKNTLQSIISLESSLVMERTPYDLLLDGHIETERSMPNPSLSISTDVGEYITKEEKGITVSEVKSIYKIEETDKDEIPTTTVYTGGAVTIHISTLHVEVTGLLLERPPSETMVISSQGLNIAQKGVQCITPIETTSGKAVFVVGLTSRIFEVYLKYKGRPYSKKVSISVEVLDIPIPKDIYAHKIALIPDAFLAGKNEKQGISKALGKYINGPFEILSSSPLILRLPFLYNKIMLCTEIHLNWDYMGALSITETESTYKLQAASKDVTVQYGKDRRTIRANTTETLRKKESNRAKSISWWFNDKSKKGKVLL